MKRPVEIVQDIIAASEFPHDEIFLDSIPKEKEDSINETQVLLTESDNGPKDYGNSDFVTLLYGVYIQIFYTNSEDAAIDITKVEIDLMKYLVSNDWLVVQSQKHYLDPDTGQMIKNITVQRTMTLSEIANS